jgi:predicted Zn-dependent protease
MQQIVGTIEKNAKEHIRVELTEFNGHDLFAVRVYAETDNGFVPTKKGVTVNVRLLPELAAAVLKAKAVAVKAGLIEQG